MSATHEPATMPARVVRGSLGAVASPHPLATGAGLAILRQGGSAVDAAIATNAALAVVAGHSCGLGGDAFWITWDPGARAALALNGSGRSGSRATIEAAGAAGHGEMPAAGPWSVTVPGAIDSWGRAHERFGRLEWADLLAPAIELAHGFPASSGWIDAIESATVAFGDRGDWARMYRPAGRPWSLGEIVRLERLHDTLRRIAAEGAAAAYTGSIGKRTAQYFETVGVPIDAADLAAHESDWAEPIGIDYRGVRSLSHPPNSVGVIALQTLGMLAQFDAPPAVSFDGRGWGDAHWLHLGLEASRLALAERDAHVTDPTRMPPGMVAEMLAPERITLLAARLDPNHVRPNRAATLPRGGGTVYVTAADRWGGLVSLLASNFGGFGSGLVDPQTGIAFQNRGSFFRLDPSHANALGPRKRTAHTLAPGMLLRDGVPWIAHGSMGGEIQPQVFAQFVSAVVDGGADVATAVAAPRWAAMMRELFGPPDLTELEPRIDRAVAAALADMGHQVALVAPWAPSMGHAHAIEVARDDSGAVISFGAASDPRSEGQAAAF